MRGDWNGYVSRLLAIEARLRACLARITRNPADTEELVQETYARLLSIDRGLACEIRSVAGFALVAARRVGLDWLRHRQRARIERIEGVEERLFCVERSATEDLVNCYQELEQWSAHIAQLPPKCAEVFTLRKVFGFSQKEVGQLLDIRVHTVEAHMLKAVRRLRGSSFDGRRFPPGCEGRLP